MGTGGTLAVRIDGQERSLTDTSIVGRDESADVVAPDERVSRRHAILRRDSEGWVYEDLDSRNGTYQDGQRVTRVAIRGYTRLRLGDPVNGPVLDLTPPYLRAAATQTVVARSPVPSASPSAREPGAPAFVPAAMEVDASRGRGWRTYARAGGIAVAIGFFLPWMSCTASTAAFGQFSAGASAAPVFRFSGYELASGPQLKTALGSQQGSGTPGLWLVLLAGMAIVVASHFVLSERGAAGVSLGSAVVAFGPLMNAWQSFEALRSPLVSVTIELGLWLTLAGCATAVVAGGLVFLPKDALAGARPAALRPP